MLSYLFSKLNKITEKQKGKIKQKNQKELTSRQGQGPPLQPAQPAKPSLSSSTPRCQAAQWQGADAVDATTTPTPFQAAPCPLLMSRSTTRQPCLTSPSSPMLSLPLRDFPFSPE